MSQFNTDELMVDLLEESQTSQLDIKHEKKVEPILKQYNHKIQKEDAYQKLLDGYTVRRPELN